MHCKQWILLGFSPISSQLKTRPRSRTLASAKQNEVVTATKPVTAYFISAHINTMVIINNRLYKLYMQRHENI